MLRRSVLILVALVGGLALLIGSAPATPPSGSIVVETARGAFLEPFKVNTRFARHVKVRLQIRGPIELATQRIVAEPGASFGWHTHPAENVNVILSGTLTLYHDEDCTEGIEYGPGTSFPTHPKDVHLARNLGTEPVVFFATYFAPSTTPPIALRLDAPSPGPGCPL